uniref:3'-5' exonuclease domain-containing protein n=1 Tax=Romanomermis culicivorax TaxID=13658 RepID=A0A915I0Q2_ROMCU
MSESPSSLLSKEEAKNMALLFFMDHLMTKNGRRTIHDLSCQFGARGFSPEMREAVGQTQEGLTEFLAQYPSLFVLEGDTVTMTGYGDLAMGGAKASPLLQNVSRDRNYEQEAVHFFEEKLRHFGPELQIKSLLGHRSQSAPEIRLVSGRHVKDFTEFLISHPENFAVENDRVRLRHMPEPQNRCSSPDESSDQDDEHGPPSPPDGKNGGAISVDEFGQPLTGAARIKQKALEFLKNAVENGYSPNSSLAGSEMDPSNKKVSIESKEILKFLKMCSKKVLSLIGSETNPNKTPIAPPGPVPIDVLYRKFCDRFLHKDRQQVATNPKELLQFLKLNRHIFFIRSNKVSIVRNKTSNNISSSTSESGDNDLNSPNSVNNLIGNNNGSKLYGNLGQSGVCRPVLLKSLLAAQNALVDVADYCQQSEQQQQRQTSTNVYCSLPFPAVAVDFKCVSLGERRFLSLIVVGLGDGSKIFVFDVAHSASVLIESGLKEMLEDEHVVKVIHDCNRIASLLYDQYKLILRNVFDTQIANAVLQHQRTGKPLHDIKPINFLTLQRLYHPQSLMYSDHSMTSTTPREDGIWSKRPLNDDLINLCAEEVRFLMPFIYRSMNNLFKSDMRSLFERLCEEVVCSLSTFSIGNTEADRNNFKPYGSDLNALSQPKRHHAYQTQSKSFNGNDLNNNNNRNLARNQTFNNGRSSNSCCSCKCHLFSSTDPKSPTLLN